MVWTVLRWGRNPWAIHQPRVVNVGLDSKYGLLGSEEMIVDVIKVQGGAHHGHNPSAFPHGDADRYDGAPVPWLRITWEIVASPAMAALKSERVATI